MTDILDKVKDTLSYIGENAEREGLLDTPKRIVNSWKEIYSGYKQDPKKILGTTFNSDGYDQMVLLKNIEMYSMCEHHTLPFSGKAHIAYIPDKRVVGISKLARLLDCYAKRMQIQERLTEQVASTIEEVLQPKGVMVVIEAQHLCMTMRGVGKQNSVMVTSAVRGAFRQQSTKEEFLKLVKG